VTEAAKVKRATVADLLAIPEQHRRHEIIDAGVMPLGSQTLALTRIRSLAGSERVTITAC
jgi:hypothetical protein